VGTSSEELPKERMETAHTGDKVFSPPRGEEEIRKEEVSKNI